MQTVGNSNSLRRMTDFRFRRSAIKYILGINSKVSMVAKIKPKIMVQLKGPQNTTLSPPKKMCGFNSENKVSKLIFSPTASGINPSTAAMAVRITGVIRVLPASTVASYKFIPPCLANSANSTSRIPFRTTIPPRAMIPTPVITILISILKRPTPKNTPMMLNRISERMMSGLPNELNNPTSTNSINPIAISMALPRKPIVSA